jgi:siroheme synthase (precorrin-2 oxidase/ferrochelatase)
MERENCHLQEDVNYLRDWLKQAEELARNIHINAREEGVLAIFAIGSTTKIRRDLRPFLTPLRRITHGFIGGAVVFSQTQAVLLSKRIDGLVDIILVDAEKKIGITIGINYGVLEYFGMTPPMEKPKARVFVEMGNLSSACFHYIGKSTFYEYKPNDITVEAIWHFLSNQLHTFSRRKITIIGCGNIGFKLALKLVECGAHVELVRRDMFKGMLMANVINITKPASTIAIAHYNSDPLQASLFSDVLLGCTDGTPAITWEMIQSMKPEGIVIDVGKGSVCKEVVQKAVEHNIPIIRCDISAAIDGFIVTMQRSREIIDQEMGRGETEDSIFVVSGGYIGFEGDIIVDNYRQPHRIIGVADGMGDRKEKLSQEDQVRLATLGNKIKQKESDQMQIARM